MIALVSAAALLPEPKLRGPVLRPAQQRSARIQLLDADARLQEAAARVLAAAQSFGSPQAEAAAAWVDEAMAAGGTASDGTKLLESQLSLFEECLLDGDDDGSRCRELDAALGALERQLMMSSAARAKAFSAFASSRFDRAAARVCSASSKFGPEQSTAASAWLAKVRKTGAANPAALLESQDAAFGECLLDEAGGSARCEELQDSLNALHASLGLRGKIAAIIGPSTVIQGG